jgi:N-methylhydantoinase A
MASARIGVDVGGTFTDAVLIDGGETWTAKSPTTPDFADGVIAACELAAERAGTTLAELLPRVLRFGLGTTAVTNAIASRKGVRTGLLITKGFEETLHLSRGHLVEDDLRMNHGFEVVEMRDVAGIDERIDRHGAVLKPLDLDAAVEAAERLVDDGVQALAVSFLWSIVNPAHERTAAQAIRERIPDIPVTAASELLPVAREYERTTLAVLNAYVSSACEGVEVLEDRLRDMGLAAPLLLVHSGGGTISVPEARARPVWLAESGPAAGVMAAASVAAQAGAKQAISCDMGGTSFDVSDIAGAEPSRITRGELMGIWTALPRVDVESIGAGGGSIGWIDARGMLRAGPQSAGSTPGPVCYGKGGTEPAVTDALVVLGYIDAENFLGGDMRLDRDAAYAACKALGEPLGLDAEAAAWGIREIALAEMTKAVRTRLALRGLDPRDHALVSFGGCASLFTADIARAVSAPRVIVPAAASVLSALGAATMGMRRERVRSLLKPLPVDAGELAAIGEELRVQVTADLAADGVREPDRAVSLEADLRFLRQNWELAIPLDAIPFDGAFTDTLRQRFESEYSQRYGEGSITLGTPVELVSLRAVGTGPAAEMAHGNGASDGSAPPEFVTPERQRQVRSGAAADMALEVAILDDAALAPGQAVQGPALIERWDTSIWVPEGASARRETSGSIIVEVTP